VGFIGLGNMGGPMATRLLTAGYDLVIHDVNSRNVQQLQQASPPGSVTVAATPRSVAETQAAAVFTMLPSTSHVQEVYEGVSEH